MQSPAVTVIWIAALNTLGLPAASFGHDASLFCVAISRPEILLYLLNTVFGVLCSVLGPWWFDVLDIYHFYQLPWGFRWRMYLLLGVFMLLYVGALFSITKICTWYKQHHQNAVVPLTA